MNVLIFLLVICGLLLWLYTSRTIENFNTKSDYIIPICIFNNSEIYSDPAVQQLAYWKNTFTILQNYRDATSNEISKYNGLYYTTMRSANLAINSNKLYYIVGLNTLTNQGPIPVGDGTFVSLVQCGEPVLLVAANQGSSSSSNRATLSTTPSNQGSSSSSNRATLSTTPSNQGSSSSSNRATLSTTPSNQGSSSSSNRATLPIPQNITPVNQTDLPADQCFQTTTQSSYQSNQCLLYKRFKVIYDTLIKLNVPYATIQKLLNAYNAAKLQLNGSQYTQTYTDIVNKFIDFDKAVTNITSDTIQLPASYMFDAPNALSLLDYAPGVATWPAASTAPKSYKCVPFSSDELVVIDSVKQFVGTDSTKKSYLDNVKTNICISKGYDIKRCTDCIGCCMPSDDAPAGVGGSDLSATVVCPKPKVRPFKIPGRELKLRVVSPKLKAQTECFVNGAGRDIHRNVHQMLKSEKFKNLQQFPVL